MKVLLQLKRKVGFKLNEEGKPVMDLLFFGRSMGSGGWLAGLIVTLFVAIFIATLLTTVFHSRYFSPIATVDEQLMYYQAARNFNQYGFLNSYLLQDFSTSSNPGHHPFVYNHMPPGPEIFVALITRVFGERYRLVRIVFLVIFLVGLLCYFRFAKLILNKLNLTGEGFTVLFIPPVVLMHMMDHPAYSPFPLFAFFPLLLLHSYHDSGKRSRYYLALVVVLVSSMYLVYQQLLMLLVCWAALSLFQLIRFDRKELLAFYTVALFGIIAHLFQSVLLLGPTTFLQEFWYTISNRTIGVPTTADLKDFYQSIGVVHQGTHPFDPAALLEALDRTLLSPGRRLVTQLGLVIVVMAFLRNFLRRRLEHSELALRKTQFLHVLSSFAGMAVWLVATNTLPLLAFPAYSANYQLSGANFLFLAIGEIAAIGYLTQEIFVHRPRLHSGLASSVKNGKWLTTSAMWVVLALGLLGCVMWQAITYTKLTVAAFGQMLRSDPHHELPDVMGKVAGKVVMTNVYPSIISLFTREATFGGCEIAAFPTEQFNHVFNAGFEDWNSLGTSPVHWTVSLDGEVGHGGNDVESRWVLKKDTTDLFGGNGSVHLTVPANAVFRLQQFVTIPRQPERYQITGAMWVKTSFQHRVRVYLRETRLKEPPRDGNLRIYSDYHPGDGMWHLLEVKTALPPNVITAPYFQYGIQVDSGHEIELYVDNAVVHDLPLRSLTQKFGHPEIASPTSAVDPIPAGIDPYSCHTAWIKRYGRSGDIKPTYYALFRSLPTGFTLCREKECLDRLEEYVASRYRKVFKDELVTIFSLEEAAPNSTQPKPPPKNDSEGPSKSSS